MLSNKYLKSFCGNILNHDPTEQANQIIAFLSEFDLTTEEKLEVIAIVRKRLEAIKQEEELNKPCKQIKLEL